ncbi:hypothetical protein BEP19_02940 [Ammoniphilus oxalaticus]|uniref:GGDEF domain-containing protein n=1 Tax=Ammoniphilus oxalaticus TaxID=66863 RepID=A0A419SNM7_9BACL|nr:GGDEF domain-containing protein [Ammoniphilus oxalaticus]RKD25900.1 hypothetical protein BEP19_02940 [Ammoniphilus oxalaticus]
MSDSEFIVISLLTLLILLQLLGLLFNYSTRTQLQSHLGTLKRVMLEAQTGKDFKSMMLDPLGSSKELEQVVLAFNEMLATIQQREKMLKKLSYTDPLTGAANRRAFEQYFDEQWGIASSNESALSVALIDIDHFKRFNDRFGHLAGDQCLKEVTVAVEQTLCNSNSFLARYGGEEFIIILPGIEIDEAAQIAEQARKNIAELRIPMGIDYNKQNFITISIGVASITPSSKMAKEDLIEVADQALYEAKSGGRNKVVIK